jgi:hypothetical protein
VGSKSTRSVRRSGPGARGCFSPPLYSRGLGRNRYRCSLVRSCNGGWRDVRCDSVDAIKQPAGGLPGKKIGIRFQGYGGPGRRQSSRKIPELEVTQDLFDDLRVFHEADDSQPAAAIGAGEQTAGPDLTDQPNPGAFAVAAEVVRFGLEHRERTRTRLRKSSESCALGIG